MLRLTVKSTIPQTVHRVLARILIKRLDGNSVRGRTIEPHSIASGTVYEVEPLNGSAMMLAQASAQPTAARRSVCHSYGGLPNVTRCRHAACRRHRNRCGGNRIVRGSPGSNACPHSGHRSSVNARSG